MFMSFKVAVVLSSIAILSGCGTKKSETKLDVYLAPEPQILTAGDQKVRQTLAQTQKLHLDLRDSWDVSSGAPKDVLFRSNCSFEGQSVTQEFAFGDSPQLIPVVSVIPESLFTKDFGAGDGVMCNFRIQLINSVGSKIVYDSLQMRIKEIVKANVVLQRSDTRYETSASRLSFTHEQASSVMIRFQNTNRTLIKAVCQNYEMVPLTIEQSIDFGRFDYTNPQPRQGLTALDVSNNPEQTCRILALEDNVVVGASTLFSFRLPQPAIAVEVLSLADRGFAAPYGAGAPVFESSQPYDLARTRYTNVGQTQRRFRISKSPMQIAAFSYWQGISELPHLVEVVKYRANHVTLVVTDPNDPKVVSSDSNFWFITLQPGASFTLAAMLTAPTPLPQNRGQFLGYGLEWNLSTMFEETSNANEVIGTVPFQTNGKVIFAKFDQHPATDLQVLETIEMKDGGDWF